MTADAIRTLEAGRFVMELRMLWLVCDCASATQSPGRDRRPIRMPEKIP